jgi:hypothetical protein
MMEKVIQQIKENFLAEYLDPKNDTWEDILASSPVTISDDILTNREKQIMLKHKLSEKMAHERSLDIDYWIIRDWGGIKGFRKSPENNDLLERLPDFLADGKLPKEVFERISSFSKVASFLNPKLYAIYDSRVIFSLNWLIFKNYGNSKKLFPQPVGRNTNLAKYHLDTVFELSGKKVEYHNGEDAYHEYCSLMQQFSQVLFQDADKPYETEMLLFQIAPNVIIEDIKDSIRLSINM